MWQLFALVSVFANACENVADKAAIVLDRRINYAIATFWRNALFLLFATIVGVCGWLGEMHFYFGWSILVFSVFYIFSSYFYTYLLQRIEVTGIAVDTYIMPIVFLAIDTVILHAHLSLEQIVGIILLTLGGLAFALDGKTHRIKREWTLAVWAIFVYWLFYDGAEYYLFKYLNVTEGVNGVSFNVSFSLVGTACMLLYIVWIRKTRLIFAKDAQKYIPAVTVSKILDTAGALFWMQALTLATVSQVSAIGAIEPIILFLVALVVQKSTRFSVREKTDRRNVFWKFGAVSLLCVGMFIVS